MVASIGYSTNLVLPVRLKDRSFVRIRSATVQKREKSFHLAQCAFSDHKWRYRKCYHYYSAADDVVVFRWIVKVIR